MRRSDHIVRRFAGPLTVAVATLTLAPSATVSAANSTFSNPTPISIPDTGTATPYPSTIQVSGLGGPVQDVDVALNGFSHTCPNDVAVLLVAPNGTTKSLLMADLGDGMGCPDSTDADLTFDDAATGVPPYPPITGSYKPSDGDAGDSDDVFPPPAPSGEAETLPLSTFNGVSPNGTWSLYVLDQASGDPGSFAEGWSLRIGAVVDRTITFDAKKTKVEKGRKVKLSGVVDAPANAAACEAAQTVELQRKKRGQAGFKTFRKVQTDGTGKYSTRVRVRKTARYRANLKASADCVAALSDTDKVKVRKT